MEEKNFRLEISYDGTRYYGWEHQPGKPTIQGKLEQVLYHMCYDLDGLETSVSDDDIDLPVEVIGAGRTDAGVHAREMTASVKLTTDFSCEEIRDYMNRYLPDDIAVVRVREASPRFHARYNAKGKTYQYTIFDGPVHPVFNRRYYTAVPENLDEAAMRKAAEYLVGEHDFRSFCGNSRFKKSSVRTIESLTVRRSKGYIYITVKGNGFLQNMVRIIAGTLIEVGQHKRPVESMEQLLLVKDRKQAGYTAPAKGLCLLKVHY